MNNANKSADKPIEFRPITKEEWDKFEWINVTTFADAANEPTLYIRGRKRTEPPNDGYVYEECTKFPDGEMKWRRVVTIVEDYRNESK